MAADFKNRVYDNISVFVNINEIKRLAGEVDVAGAVSPSSPMFNKLSEIVLRARSLMEFEILSDSGYFGRESGGSRIGVRVGAERE